MLVLKGLNLAQVLAALYNASRPQGMGFMQYNPTPMTEDEASELLTQTKYFDYLKGRVMKLDMSSPFIDEGGYDRDNGQGAAQRAIDAAASKNDVAIQEAHRKGVKDAAEIAKKSMNTPYTIDGGVITLTLADVKDDLAPKVNEALKVNE